MKKLFNQFNQPETVMVVTSFPDPLKGKKGKRDFNAVAWHSEKTFANLSKDRRTIVLAEKNDKKNKAFFAGKNLYVQRVWSKDSHLSILNLALIALKFNRVKKVFIPFEFNLLGGTLHNLLLLVVLFILRLAGKNVFIEIHQVIEDIKKLEKHINIKGALMQKFFNLGLKMYYYLFGLLSTNIIVFENELKKRLVKYINPEKISVLSLGVEIKEPSDQLTARKKLKLPKNKFLVMAFGYINGYKGLDFMTEAFSKTKERNTKLLIAGGENPYLKDKPHYQEFYSRIISNAEKTKNILVTGFVPDKKVGLYFSAADLVILPYEVFMSASGPFSLALSYGKPVILSDKLIEYKYSQDFQEAMNESDLKKSEIFFKLKSRDVLALIKLVKNGKNLQNKLTTFSKLLAGKRNQDTVVGKYQEIMFNKKLNRMGILRLPFAIAQGRSG